jgi:transposase
LDELLANKRIHQKAEESVEENLCLDAGYRSKDGIAAEHGYVPHIRTRKEEGEEKKSEPGKKARRWVVEAHHSWTNRFRKLVPRYEKTDLSFCALLHLAYCMIALNKVIVIYG